MEKQTIEQALIKAQAEFPVIPKNRTGQVGTRHYKYADLADVLKLVTPVLQKHGLCVFQTGIVLEGKQALRTIVASTVALDKLGSDFLLPETSDPQKAGANITYYRRYALCSILGITAEDDVDASTGEGKAEPKQSTPLFEEDIPSFPPTFQRSGTHAGNGDYVIPLGKFKDQKISAVPKKDLVSYAVYIRRTAKEKNEAPKGKMKELLERIDSL